MLESGSDFFLAMTDFMRREGVREQRAAKIVLGAARVIERTLMELRQVSLAPSGFRMLSTCLMTSRMTRETTLRRPMTNSASGVELGHVQPAARGRRRLRQCGQGQGEAGGRDALNCPSKVHIRMFCSAEVINYALK